MCNFKFALRAALYGSRSAFPNFTPLIVQFVSSGDLGVLCSNDDANEWLATDAKVFTALVIASSSALGSIGSRGSRWLLKI
jgi:hypothetical protein